MVISPSSHFLGLTIFIFPNRGAVLATDRGAKVVADLKTLVIRTMNKN
jgi:hypothetical protein